MSENEQNPNTTNGAQPKAKSNNGSPEKPKPQKKPGFVFYFISSIIIIILILLLICCFFKKDFSKNPLLLPGVLFVFMFFDFLTFFINHHIYLSQKNDNSEPLKYYPNFKTWGIGFILGMAIFMISYLKPLKDILLDKKDALLKKSEIVLGNNLKLIEYRETSLEIIQQVAIMLFFLAIIGFILAAIVKITRDD